MARGAPGAAGEDMVKRRSGEHRGAEDVLMRGVDLHLHLLPGVDDGARDLTASLAHARRLADEGVAAVTVTPHVSHDVPLDVATLPERTAALQEAIDAERIALRVYTGGEVHPDRAATLTDSELEYVAQGPTGARWILLEVPFAGIDQAFVDLCGELRKRGFAAVIAHPERAAHGHARLAEPVALGAVLQVNVDSLLGRHGDGARERAAWLVRSGRAYGLASDGHPGTRDQTLGEGLHAALALGVTPARALRLIADNPRFLLRAGLPGVGGGAVQERARRGRGVELAGDDLLQ
jgi:protein-tyrosine phosphatase